MMRDRSGYPPLCAADFERRAKAVADCTVTEHVDGFDRIIAIEVGYDHRNLDCLGGNNHGQHGMGFRFVLRGPKGAVQFLYWASNMVPGRPLHSHQAPSGGFMAYPLDIMAADLGYHWPTARYDGQGTMECEWLDGGVCYYDGSGLNAEPILERFLAEGPAGVWESLRDYYDRLTEEP